MKRKPVIIFVFTVMVLAISAIVFIINVNIDVVNAAFTSSNPTFSKSAAKFILSVFLIVMCWISLLVIFIRLLHSDNFIEFGKKDGLTKIGNKNYLQTVFKHRTVSYGSQLFFVYFGVKTKRITDKYDSELLDEVQRSVAATLSDECLENEYVARLGNGEFAMIMSETDGVRAEQRIFETVDKLNQCEYRVLYEIISSFHSGFCSVDDESTNYLTAYENAKNAYFHAVSRSVNTLIFSDGMATLDETNKLKSKKYTDALKNKEFEIFVQFILDTKKNKFAGVETLSRWNSEEGFKLPGSYISEMQRCGAIEEFDMYMFEKACNLLQNWKNDSAFNDLFVSCNITRISVSSNKFIKKITEISSRYDFLHDKLILELTEDAFFDDTQNAYKNLKSCRDLGFKIALDDFGAGHTSFSDIRNCPFDQIKIDREFTKTIGTKRDTALLNAFIEMAHNLDIEVVCEGVETKEQSAHAKDLKFDYIQGYYYSYVYPMSEVRQKISEPVAE